MRRDQKFFDMYSLVIGGLAAVCLGFFVLAMNVNEKVRGDFQEHADVYIEAVNARLEPFGEVYLPGDDLSAGGPQVVAVESAEPVETVMSGPQVYNGVCIACHGTGIGGAPKFGDAAAWGPRIEQGLDVLTQHAIHGYQGSTGFMPPKGGRMDLSDEEVASAVEYMVSEAQK
ncbi:MAG TPA: cytochrome c5 family protein [Woeseiaceae bacterium]|nr:cytochrome c5 family protein [Woeseiaceae bacterium]